MSQHLLSLTSLFVISLATSIIPGPTNFIVMRLGMRHGRAAALAAGLGATASCIVWCAAAALGLAALLAAAPWLYKALRIGGGLYLLWFAFALWRAKADGVAAPEPETGGREAVRDSFWQGFAVNMTNPKAALFFASIFSAYVGPQTPLWVEAAAIAVVVGTCLGWQVAVALLFSAQRAAGAYRRAQRPLDRGAAVLMGGFGASLILLE